MEGCEVYRLYSDNTEGLCVDAKEIADHAAKGGMLGISKESWMAALEKENYLKAAEMSMEDDYGMIDGIINNGPKEDKTAEVKMVLSSPLKYRRLTISFCLLYTSRCV